MMLYYLLCSIVILPLVYSGNVAKPTQEVKSNLPVKAASNNKNDFSLHSEGGTLLASGPDLSLSKDKQLTNLELDGELENHNDKTPIKARKGVDNFTDNHMILKGTTQLPNSIVTPNTNNSKNESHPPLSKITTKGNVNKANLTNLKPIATTEVHKKPLILSYESLVNADKNSHDESKILPANPSSKTIPSSEKNQIPSPNDDAVVKVYPSKANSHPGMIMPIVITILVVPMFAFVGYMALRRGQEAWKNRHYKRMDFLLDGMYND